METFKFQVSLPSNSTMTYIFHDKEKAKEKRAEFLEIDERFAPSEIETFAPDSKAIIVNKNDKPYGLVVDSFDRKQEIVVKRLGDSTNSSDSFTNATILPDGKVALILDPALLV